MYKPEKIPLLEQSRINDIKTIELIRRMKKTLEDPENVDKEKAYDELEEFRQLNEEAREINKKLKALNSIVCPSHKSASKS